LGRSICQVQLPRSMPKAPHSPRSGICFFPAPHRAVDPRSQLFSSPCGEQQVRRSVGSCLVQLAIQQEGQRQYLFRPSFATQLAQSPESRYSAVFRSCLGHNDVKYDNDLLPLLVVAHARGVASPLDRCTLWVGFLKTLPPHLCTLFFAQGCSPFGIIGGKKGCPGVHAWGRGGDLSSLLGLILAVVFGVLPRVGMEA